MIDSRNIEDLVPEAQKKCKEFVQLCLEAGIKTQVIQTLRDSEYQNSLYNQGRTKPGKIVTKCDGYKLKSKHQEGKAFDIVPIDNATGKALWNDQVKFKRMAEIGKKLGLRCGFYFKAVDSPHFEIM